MVNNASDIAEGTDASPVLTTDGTAWTFLLDTTEEASDDPTVDTSDSPEAEQAVRDLLAKYPARFKISMTFDEPFTLKAVANAK